MSIEFQKAIEKRRILLFSQGKRQVKKELQEAENDLRKWGHENANENGVRKMGSELFF